MIDAAPANDAGQWYYGYGGYFGEPDFSGPARFKSPKDASDRWGANYDIAGPFVNRAEALAALDRWLASNEDAPISISEPAISERRPAP